MNWKTWLHGLIGAAIGSAASVVSGFAVGIGWQKLGQQALVSAVVGAGLYLSKSPIWSTTTTLPDGGTVNVPPGSTATVNTPEKP